MKRKAKVRRRRDLPPLDISETGAELSGAPATPGRISIESVDEHKIGSIESVAETVPEKGVASFIELDVPDAEGARSPDLQR